MLPRERFLRTLSYAGPDRLPVVYHPSPAGLHVHGQKLLDLFQRFPPDNPIEFHDLPTPDPEAVAPDGSYRELQTDAWGTVWEHLIFGVAGHPYTYPIPDWKSIDALVFPPTPLPKGPTFEEERARLRLQKERFLTTGGGISIFERLHALRPIDDILMALADGDRGLTRLLERLEAYWTEVIGYQIALGVDAIWFGDDWGTQTAPIISPTLFRNVFRPIYARLFDLVKSAGARVFFHSCGDLGPIFDDLLDLGIDLIWPQISWFEANPHRMALCRERRVAFYVHPDRQRLVPLGTPNAIRAEMRRYAELGHSLNGGVIFYVEIENDAPFENIRTLIESIHEFR